MVCANIIVQLNCRDVLLARVWRLIKRGHRWHCSTKDHRNLALSFDVLKRWLHFRVAASEQKNAVSSVRLFIELPINLYFHSIKGRSRLHIKQTDSEI